MTDSWQTEYEWVTARQCKSRERRGTVAMREKERNGEGGDETRAGNSRESESFDNSDVQAPIKKRCKT